LDGKLASLLLDLSELDDDDARSAVFDKYVELYLDRGSAPRRTGAIRTHDSRKVVFFEDRFEHAFSETIGWQRKGTFSRRRGERVAWIGPVVRGEIAGTECWLVPPKNGGRRDRIRRRNRVYIVARERYVVWLEPLGSDAWKFSSAYVAGHGDIRRYRRSGRRLWAHQNTP